MLLGRIIFNRVFESSDEIRTLVCEIPGEIFHFRFSDACVDRSSDRGVRSEKFRPNLCLKSEGRCEMQKSFFRAEAEVVRDELADGGSFASDRRTGFFGGRQPPQLHFESLIGQRFRTNTPRGDENSEVGNRFGRKARVLGGQTQNRHRQLSLGKGETLNLALLEPSLFRSVRGLGSGGIFEAQTFRPFHEHILPSRGQKIKAKVFHNPIGGIQYVFGEKSTEVRIRKLAGCKGVGLDVVGGDTQTGRRVKGHLSDLAPSLSRFGKWHAARQRPVKKIDGKRV